MNFSSKSAALILTVIALSTAMAEDNDHWSFAELVSRWAAQNDKVPFIRAAGHTENYKWDVDSSSWKLTPATDTFRLTFENKASGRYLLELDPSITEWTNGAAPWGASWTTEFRDADGMITHWSKGFQHHDGTHFLLNRMEENRISKRKQAEHERSYAEGVLSGVAYTPLGAILSFDNWPVDALEKNNQFAVTPQTDGTVRLDSAWATLGERFELIVDPAKDYALVRFVRAHDWKEGNSHDDFVNTYEVLEHKKLPNGIWYPTRFGFTRKYSDKYAQHLAEKNKNSGPERFQAKKRLVIFEKLEVLPATSDPGTLFSVAFPGEKAAQAKPGIFEVRAMTKTPTETAKPYSLPHREGGAETILVEPEVLLDQSAINVATVENDADGSPQIYLRLSKDGAKKFGEITEKYLNQRIAMFVDGHPQSAPVIRQPILGGTAIISGTFTKEEAEQLADKLNEPANARPLPDELKPVSDFSKYKSGEELWQLLEGQGESEKHLHAGEWWTLKEQNAFKERQYTIACEILRRFPNDSRKWEAKQIKAASRDTPERAIEGRQLINEMATSSDVPSGIKKWATYKWVDEFVAGKGQSGEAEIENYCRQYPEDLKGCAQLKVDSARWYLDSQDPAIRVRGEAILKELIATGPGSILRPAEELLGSQFEILKARAERDKNSGERWAFARDAKVKELAQFIGQPFDFNLTALDGSSIGGKGMRGKVVLIDFWGTWCGVCVQRDLPHLTELYKKYHDRGLEIVGIAKDQNAEIVRKFVTDKAVAWPQHWDEGDAITKSYKIEMFPTAFLVNKEGRIAENASYWAYPDSADGAKPWSLEAEIEKLLLE